MTTGKRAFVEVGAFVLVLVLAVLSKTFGWESSRAFWAVWGVTTGVIVTTIVFDRLISSGSVS